MKKQLFVVVACLSLAAAWAASGPKLNIVTGHEDDPQGVLIRGIDEIHGPGRVTKTLELDNECNGINITECKTLSIEKGSSVIPCQATPRIGIAYASKEDQEKPLRFVAVHEGTE